MCSHQSPPSSQACTASGWRQGSPAACMRMATHWLTAPGKAAPLIKRPASRSWRRRRCSSNARLDATCRLRSCMLTYSTRLSRAAHICVAQDMHACVCRAVKRTCLSRQRRKQDTHVQAVQQEECVVVECMAVNHARCCSPQRGVTSLAHAPMMRSSPVTGQCASVESVKCMALATQPFPTAVSSYISSS